MLQLLAPLSMMRFTITGLLQRFGTCLESGQPLTFRIYTCMWDRTSCWGERCNLANAS